MDNSRLDKFATGQFATFANFHFGRFATFILVNSRLSFWTIRDYFCHESSKIRINIFIVFLFFLQFLIFLIRSKFKCQNEGNKLHKQNFEIYMSKPIIKCDPRLFARCFFDSPYLLFQLHKQQLSLEADQFEGNH